MKTAILIFTALTLCMAIFNSFAAIAEIVMQKNGQRMSLGHSLGAAIFWTIFYLLAI